MSNFVSLMTKVKTLQKDRPQERTVIMSTDGFNRPGAFSTCFFLRQQFDHYISQNVKPAKMSFTVFNIVRVLREQRYNMVSSIEQYKFLYEYLKKLLGINTAVKKGLFRRSKK